MRKINKKYFRQFSKSYLELIKLEICLSEVEQMIFEQNVYNNKPVENISACSEPWMSKSKIHRILQDIFERYKNWEKLGETDSFAG